MTTPPHLHDHLPSVASEAGDQRGPQSGAEIALDYARRMFERQHVPLPPLGFQVDWADQPSRHKLYQDAVKVPLPEPFRSMPSVGFDTAVRTARSPAAARDADVPGLGVLATMLGCCGLTDRRTEPNWNDDSTAKIRAEQAVWARPTASGGGMYPAESYLVVGRRGPLAAGVYHYDTAHHSLDRLAIGDRCAEIATATGVRAELYAVSTLRFWKNAFKYNSFAYHVVSQDVGALLASWRLVLAAHGAPAEPVLWFDEAAVSAVLDVDGHDEAPFVVVPLGPATEPPAAGRDPAERIRVGGPHRVWERSRRVRSFELVGRVHAAALVGDRPRPGPDAARAGAEFGTRFGSFDTGTAGPALPGPAPRPGDLDVGTALLARRTSFGLFSARPALDIEDLGWVLSSVTAAGHAGTDVAPAPRDHAWTRLWVLSNSVAGLEQRVYGYDAARGRLVAGAPVDVAGLQRFYALTNYSLPEVAAIVVVTGRLDALVAAYGARGYRMLGIEVGQAAQTAYLAATARGLGVGAVLGLDNIGLDELLGIDGTGEKSMIFMLLGHERRPRPRYDHGLYRFGAGREAGSTQEGTTR
ncbi:SagB family peptide dehydrogenase [Actinomadura alba]|uniref:SagB family peptide dehydrogenase n=1 Tax=Actinomadura alba TaxID=406431 RepID=A0ABR7LT20_9ACTN|nr:SagB family peptide dehydrogenase [Actinomadura alba]MBC6467891.1 SagB family peptide dehydrogenase [Actinomadura alba]